VRISSGAAFAETTLTVELTGTYDLAVESVSGVLSLSAQQGKPARLAISVKNTGTAPQNHVGLFSFQPENWIVDFVPDAVDGLASGETRQVEVIVTPHEKALVGDYSLELKANGERFPAHRVPGDGQGLLGVRLDRDRHHRAGDRRAGGAVPLAGRG
jgi:uncharacterized membrane protein